MPLILNCFQAEVSMETKIILANVFGKNPDSLLNEIVVGVVVGVVTTIIIDLLMDRGINKLRSLNILAKKRDRIGKISRDAKGYLKIKWKEFKKKNSEEIKDDLFMFLNNLVSYVDQINDELVALNVVFKKEENFKNALRESNSFKKQMYEDYNQISAYWEDYLVSLKEPLFSLREKRIKDECAAFVEKIKSHLNQIEVFFPQKDEKKENSQTSRSNKQKN